MNTALKSIKSNALLTLGRIEKIICITALSSLVLIALVESMGRLFGWSMPALTGLITHLLLMLGLFAGMLTSKNGSHISISFFHFLKNEKIKNILALISGVFAVFICTILAWASISSIKVGIVPRSILFIPNIVFSISMPLGFIIMAIRFGLQLPSKKWLLFAIAVVFGTAFSFSAVSEIFLVQFEPEYIDNVPDYIRNFTYDFNAALNYLKIPLIIIFIAMALIGAPVFTVIAGITFLMILSNDGVSETVTNKVFAFLTEELNMIAIPLFTLAGFILSESKAGYRLVRFFRSIFGKFHGGVIIATVVLCTFFTSFTGASGVTILALGGILLTVLTGNSGYSKKTAIGLLTSVGAIGLLFPPSLPILLTGVRMRENTMHMFYVALIPGIIMVVAMIAVGMFLTRKTKIQTDPFSIKNIFSSLKESALELLLPVFLMLGYFGGIFLLHEISAICVIYVLIVEVFIHRDIKIKELHKIFLKAIPIIGGLLCVIALANALSFAIVDARIPEVFTDWIKETIQSKYVFLLLLNLALLLVGCIMDIFSAIMIILPLISPMIGVYDIDPIHLGVIFLINLSAGFITPPVGLNLFLGSYRFEQPFSKICRYVLPFLAVQIAVVLLVTYIPALSTFLPGLFK